MKLDYIKIIAEPMGNGYQAHVNGDSRRWGRGNTIDEAIGSVVRNNFAIEVSPCAARLFKEHQEQSLAKAMGQ